jgi:hypothetical protein
MSCGGSNSTISQLFFFSSSNLKIEDCPFYFSILSFRHLSSRRYENEKIEKKNTP